MNSSLPARPIIGATRARFLMHWPWYTWALPPLLPAGIALLVLLMGDILAAVIGFILVTILATVPILLFMASFQIHVTERALVVGPFVPGYHRQVHLFSDIDTSTIRAWSNLSAYLRASRTPALMTAGHVNSGAKHGITFRVHRVGELQNGKLTENEVARALGGTTEVMSVAGHSKKLIHSLATAMERAGVARADAIIAQALPPGRLSPQRDAHLQQIPGWRQPKDDSVERFEDLPPELQQALRRSFNRS